MPATRKQIMETFALFRGQTGGLDSWLSEKAPEEVFVVLSDLELQPLTCSRLNQLLTLSHEAPMSDPFFRYYWLSAPTSHPYDVKAISRFNEMFCEQSQDSTVASLDHLYWGLYRFYVDALLFFGNIRTAFQHLRELSEEGLADYFQRKCFDSNGMTQRGNPLSPETIDKGNRYLISEMAFTSLNAPHSSESELAQTLVELYGAHTQEDINLRQLLEGANLFDLSIANQDDLLGKLDLIRENSIELYRQHMNSQITAGQLLKGAQRRGTHQTQQPRLVLTADDFLDDPIVDENDLLGKIDRVHKSFEDARKIALANTDLYLSMISDLDVYVATSMRDRADFERMADFCKLVFTDSTLEPLNLRYFDPTLSAASGHEDKGLIECLMVKRAKVLILYAGSRDSYGKDAESAMALSLGKPVIIYAEDEMRSQFFKEVHPLTRLIDFQTGVAIGAMVATSATEVIELLRRIFANRLEFELEQTQPGYLVLRESITKSTVRLQTSNELIRETFWNHYHRDIRRTLTPDVG